MSVLNAFSDEDLLGEIQRRKNGGFRPQPLLSKEQLHNLENNEGLDGIKKLVEVVDKSLDENGLYSDRSHYSIVLAAYEFVYGKKTWEDWNS
jgi:hypothetical protein